MSKPICTIIGGVNGSGKTTFALDYLANNVACKYFINADLVAVGLLPLDPTQQQITANACFHSKLNKPLHAAKTLLLKPRCRAKLT